MPALGKAGYSLLEILVALAIFSIAALALTSGVTTAVRANNLSEHFTQATILAQDKLEALRSHPFSLTGGSDVPQTGFSRVWSIAPATPQIGVTQVDLSVSWTDYLPHTVTLSTIIND